MFNKKYFLQIFIISFLFFGLSFSVSQAAYISQCDTGKTSGEQTNCTHDSDEDILTKQCVKYYSSKDCSSMSSYLSVMANECWALKNSKVDIDVDCGIIFQGGYYGREASEYAEYVEKNGLPTDRYNQLANSTSSSSIDDDLDQIVGDFNFPDHPKGVEGVFGTILTWLISIIGIIAIIAFIISGLQYFLAAGDEGMAETAKRNMTYSIIGVIVALSGYVIWQAIAKLLQGASFF